jgi:hypothetical protein
VCVRCAVCARCVRGVCAVCARCVRGVCAVCVSPTQPTLPRQCQATKSEAKDKRSVEKSRWKGKIKSGANYPHARGLHNSLGWSVRVCVCVGEGQRGTERVVRGRRNRAIVTTAKLFARNPGAREQPHLLQSIYYYRLFIGTGH